MEIKAYEKLPKEAKDIRREVFVDEQGFKMNLMILIIFLFI